MNNPMYSDQPEICSIHQCEMDGEYCPACYAEDMEVLEAARQVTSQQKPSVGRETKHRHPITGE